MNLSSLLTLPQGVVLILISAILVASEDVICSPSECMRGTFDTNIGISLGSQPSILLLPGDYSSSTNPTILRDSISSRLPSIQPRPGFETSSRDAQESLPNSASVSLDPGFATYSSPLYSGKSSFIPLSNISASQPVSLTTGALALPDNVWAAVSTGQGSERIVLWHSIPDISQLPIPASLSISTLQSATCSTPCAGGSTCTAQGTCACPTGFTGTSCESCAAGFFGPECKACPEDCDTCDEGVAGTGRCLKVKVANDPSSCNCLNGQCGSDGQCTCSTGWTTKAGDTSSCSKCAVGFFTNNNGDCQACAPGCTQCSDVAGTCLSCDSGLTLDANDSRFCVAPPASTSGGQQCPPVGFFAQGSDCVACDTSCRTCTGATSNDCVACADGLYNQGGRCVSASTDGICEGGGLIADNVRQTCTTCGSQCTECKISGFTRASSLNSAECTKCLPGSVLSEGKCLDECPAGTFRSPQDNMTCLPCDSSCGSCTNSATFCLTCAADNQLAFNGKCASSCPEKTFSTSGSGSCTTCHGDCQSCSGSSFNQCLTCPPERPVLINGRCLTGCGRKDQFFDSSSGRCETCDSGCGSCSGPGPNRCLACASDKQVLRGGKCVDAACADGSSVVPGLGVCLSDLAKTSGDGTSGPPSNDTQPGQRPLEWWQILLMVLGCAFILLIIVLLWRRHARKQREKNTKQFANARGLVQRDWKWRLVRFGEKLFGHRASPDTQPAVDDTSRLRAAEEARHARDMDDFLGAYDYTRPQTDQKRTSGAPSSLNRSSVFSYYTSKRPQAPETRQVEPHSDVRSSLSYWVEPAKTGSSNNPFRKL